MEGHEKVYTICDNMCLEESLTKVQIEEVVETEVDTKVRGYGVPVGSIMNYDGTTPPAGYEETTDVIGDLNDLNTTDKTNLVNAINEVNLNVNKNVYSTTETEIGTWMGKKLYRKMYQITTVDGTNTYTIDISNLGATHAWINTGESFVEATSGEVKGFNFFEDATNFYLRGLITNNSTITVKVAGGQYYCGPTYICLEYTKD